jgi:hypothetical protein
LILIPARRYHDDAGGAKVLEYRTSIGATHEGDPTTSDPRGVRAKLRVQRPVAEYRQLRAGNLCNRIN